MRNAKLANAILDALVSSHSFFEHEDGTRFEAITQSDLMLALRERGWKLPGAGWFLREVKEEGFKVTQGYQFKGKVRRSYKDGRRGHALSDYQTIIYL